MTSAQLPMRILIVDDEAPARARLRDLLADIGATVPNIVTGEAADGAAALEALERAEADVVITDIRMPRMDGIELARHVSRRPNPPAIVFVTAYDQYAVKAFELSATDYLLKPVRAARLADALAKARRGSPSPEEMQKLAPGGRQFLHSVERGRILLVAVSDIVYLKAELKYVTARTPEREFLLEESLTHLEEEFGERFVRVHRNCLVARDALAGCERTTGEDGEIHWEVLLRGLDERLPVSRRQWPQVKAILRE